MKYKVTIPYAVFVTVEVDDAESQEEAINIAMDDGCLGGFCGKGFALIRT